MSYIVYLKNILAKTQLKMYIYIYILMIVYITSKKNIFLILYKKIINSIYEKFYNA